jgi:hypothetical protein
MRRRRLLSLGLYLLSLLAAGAPFFPAAAGKLPAPSFPLTARLGDGGVVELSWSPPRRQTPRQQILLRSTTDLRTTKDAVAFPIARLDAHGSLSSYNDALAPQGVPLSYQLQLIYEDGQAEYSSVAFVTLPAPRVGALSQPSLLIDKPAYTLSLLDRGLTVRRFPIALGANPVNRKLHLDRASTPEGRYRIVGLQPRAEYYRAYDLDYPNEVDRVRYRVLADNGQLPQPLPSIGGEIQIHGEGIASNWTWGCIALNNSDMDLLFSLSELSQGTQVLIVGSELSREDLESEDGLSEAERLAVMEHLVRSGIASGRSVKHWLYGLCKFQARQGLLVTGLFDCATRRAMEREGLVFSSAISGR